MPLPLRLHQACPPQLREVMADRRLRQPDRRRPGRNCTPRRPRLPNSSETSFTRAGSANALRRNAISNAAASSNGPAATGEQHTGADISTTGNVFGMPPSCHKILTYIEEVAS